MLFANEGEFEFQGTQRWVCGLGRLFGLPQGLLQVFEKILDILAAKDIRIVLEVFLDGELRGAA